MSKAAPPRRWISVITAGVALVMIAVVVATLAGLAVGYRPVVIQTGSMGDAAPPGSLVVAAPRAADAVEVGDILVMRRPGSAPVTHRVIEIQYESGNTFAITKGDANTAADPAPYVLADGELVARWVTPGAGSALESLRSPRLLMAGLGLLLLVITVVVLRRIWAGNRHDHEPPSPPTSPPSSSLSVPLTSTAPPTVALPPPSPPPPMPPAPPPPPPSGARQPDPPRRRPISVRVAAGVAVLTVFAGAGVVWSLQSSTAGVDANQFGAADCFEPQLSSVQTGETTHATSGTLIEPITTIDPSRAFVMTTVRSDSNEIADSAAQVRLASDSTLEIERVTDAGSPPSITVAWSVVEYGCGIDVQRGTVDGDGTNQLNVPISDVDVTSSFVLVNALAPPAAADFGPEHLFASELSAADTLTIRADVAAAFPLDQRFAWQVVTFLDPADIDVQTSSATLGVGVTSDTMTLASPVDLDTTFITTSVTSAALGPDVGERLVRAHLIDPTTVAIVRDVAGDAVEVHVQAATMTDGTTVRHGTVDLSTGSASAAVSIEPVDATRSTAISTVAIPGAVAGGMTDHVTDDVIGEATATVVVTDPTTVTITRNGTTSDASFGWQVIEWAGPSWWDVDYTFRQRINVDATTVAAPDDYTVAFSVDHASLVASGLARPDGHDLRVLRWDGVAWGELDRVLDDGSAWDQTDTTMRFRTTDPIAAGQTATYWLYMSNPTAAAAPNDPEAVYLLSENFDAGGLGDFEDRTAGTSWYSAASWTRRIPLTIPAGQVGSTLNDFALLVSLTNGDLAANAQPDGSDIRFTAGDGSTALAHEIESYNSGTGTIEAWVRIPTLSAVVPTTVYLYYGAADAPSHEDVHGAWSDDVEAVWHLDRDPDGSAPQLDDSSQWNHDGLSAGAMTGSDLVPGLVGAALDLDGVDDAVQADRLDLEGLNELTISAWVQLDTATNDARLFSKSNGPLDRQADLAVQTDGSVHARLLLDSGEAEAVTATGLVTTTGWHHVAMTWDGSDLVIVVDGLSAVSLPTTGTIEARHEMPVHLGNTATLDHGIDGVLDEVRAESAARSVDWLAAAETSQRDPATFLSVGVVESGSWFGQGTWSFRKPVVVDSDQVSTDLFEFPLMVQITDARLQAAAQACGCDLVFTGADGTTRLDHLVETYDSGTGALTAWVSVPVLSGSEDTELFLYYGNPTAVDQQDPPAVFGNTADLQILGAP